MILLRDLRSFITMMRKHSEQFFFYDFAAKNPTINQARMLAQTTLLLFSLSATSVYALSGVKSRSQLHSSTLRILKYCRGCQRNLVRIADDARNARHYFINCSVAAGGWARCSASRKIKLKVDFRPADTFLYTGLFVGILGSEPSCSIKHRLADTAFGEVI